MLKPQLNIMKLFFKRYLAVEIEIMFNHFPVNEVFWLVREVVLVLWLQVIPVLAESTSMQSISFLTHSASSLGHRGLCVIRFS
jgi:hypothetical protein